MRYLLVAATTLLLAACARAPEATVPSAPPVVAAAVSVAVPAPPPVAIPADMVTVLVHKSPTCGCCGGWVEHLRASGFVVQVDDTDSLDLIKARLGVPADKAACHTAEVGGYVIEGHVPAEDIRRLLAEKPAARGLVLPGMPMGSPGMGEPGSGPPYTVELLATDGSSRSFQQH